MIWLPRTTDNSTYFAQSLEIRGIGSRLYLQAEWKTNVDPDQLARKPADQDLLCFHNRQNTSTAFINKT